MSPHLTSPHLLPPGLPRSLSPLPRLPIILILSTKFTPVFPTAPTLKVLLRNKTKPFCKYYFAAATTGSLLSSECGQPSLAENLFAARISDLESKLEL